MVVTNGLLPEHMKQTKHAHFREESQSLTENNNTGNLTSKNIVRLQ